MQLGNGTRQTQLGGWEYYSFPNLKSRIASTSLSCLLVQERLCHKSKQWHLSRRKLIALKDALNLEKPISEVVSTEVLVYFGSWASWNDFS